MTTYYLSRQRRVTLKAYRQAGIHAPRERLSDFSIEFRPAPNGFSLAGTF